MCLYVFAWRSHPDYPLILAGNRDEFDARPTRTAHYWPDAPWILAGRDLSSHGTWLGVTRQGRIALITNVRAPDQFRPDRPSRGDLVAAYLRGKESPQDYLNRLQATGTVYNGFNLILGNVFTQLLYWSNYGLDTERIPAGLYGLSNAGLNTAWPKVSRAKRDLAACLQQKREPKPAELLSLLADTTQPRDQELPDTGVGLDLERMLAPVCVHSSGYGTQVSTVILVRADGWVQFWEKPVRQGGEERVFTFQSGHRPESAGG